MNKIIILSLMIISTIIGAFGSLYLKRGAYKTEKKLKSFLLNYNLIIGVSLYLTSLLVYFYLLNYEEVSLLYPMTSLAYIWVLLISKKYLNEKITKTKIASVICIVLGITIILI